MALTCKWNLTPIVLNPRLEPVVGPPPPLRIVKLTKMLRSLCRDHEEVRKEVGSPPLQVLGPPIELKFTSSPSGQRYKNYFTFQKNKFSKLKLAPLDPPNIFVPPVNFTL